MSRKFTQTRVSAFLTALVQTGNQSLAAERARVSRSWVTSQRSSDPAFDAAVRAAIDAARAALREQAEAGAGAGSGADAGAQRGGTCKPARGLAYLDGVELVVRGTGGNVRGPVPGGGKRVQVARARAGQWSPRTEERFLAALTASCNVKAACAEVGLTPASAYNHRQRWPRFAERWAAAEEVGYTQLEFALIEAGCNPLSGAGLSEVAPLTGMTFAQALHLLHMHKHAARGLGKRPGLPPREVDIEELRAVIAHRLEVLQRHAARQGAGRAEAGAVTPPRPAGAAGNLRR